MVKIMIVTCEGCGSQYEMPDIGVKPIMKDCPVCKQLKEAIDKINREIGLG